MPIRPRPQSVFLSTVLLLLASSVATAQHDPGGVTGGGIIGGSTERSTKPATKPANKPTSATTPAASRKRQLPQPESVRLQQLQLLTPRISITNRARLSTTRKSIAKHSISI